jgi:hypothetical protein
MENYQEYKKIKGEIDATLQQIENRLHSFPKNEMGYANDEARKTPEYIETKKQWNKYWSLLRSINQIGVKKFKKEIQNEYQDKINAANKKHKETLIK